MSIEHRHIIRRQLIELRLPSRQDAFRIQSRISQLFQEEVTQRLALHFDRLGLGEAVLRIPKLEINLGRISPGALDRDFADHCAEAIQMEVERILRQLDLNARGSHPASKGPAEDNQLISAAHHSLSVLKLFLTRGLLPPAYQGSSWAALEAQWMEAWETNGHEMLEMLRELAATAPYAIGRLVRQFSPAWIKAMLEHLQGQPSPTPVAEMPTMLPPARAAIKAMKLLGFSPLVWEALPEWLKEQLQQWVAERELPAQWTAPRPAQLQLQAEIFRAILLQPLAERPDFIRRQLSDLIKVARKEEGQEATVAHQEEARKPETPSASAKERPETEKLSVQHAGLVILHPFLPAFFDSLGYLEGKGWKNEEVQERALHLLLYLSQAEEQLGEHDFAFPKLLCGWPLDEAADRFISLTNEEKQEAEDLLQAVINHWAALKTTSAALLQDGFLQRSALLRERPDDWLLQVERKAQDILLDKLPWGISVVKLPWMEKRVVVEW